jgi:glutamyl-tRNA synthetase
MVNFLALLGWSPGDDRELFTRDELIAAFALEGISGGNAVFNPEKLEWFNNQHIMRLPAETLAGRVEPLLRAAGTWDEAFTGARRAWLLSLIELLKPRAHRLQDFVAQAQPLVSDAIEYDAAAVGKHLAPAGTRAHLEALRAALAALPAFDAASIERAVRALAEARGVKAGTLIHAARVAVTGRTVSPGIFEVLELLGRDRALARLDRTVEMAG